MVIENFKASIKNVYAIIFNDAEESPFEFTPGNLNIILKRKTST